MKKFSKRYAGYLVKKSLKYVRNHPADFIRLGIMTGVVLSTNDSCLAKTLSEGGKWSSMMEPLNNVKDLCVDVIGPLLFGGGVIVTGGKLIKGESRDTMGTGVAVAGGGGLMMNADTIVDSVSGCLM